ncbi:hypothetical protein TNCV_1604181 [Trichonephila clavipes]|nr:hypothetical protein TNCV_1604181 [Trichonephila clavipes]
MRRVVGNPKVSFFYLCTDESRFCHRDGRISVWRHLVFFTHRIGLLPWPACRPCRRKRVVHACTPSGPGYTTRCYTRSTLKYVEAAWTAVPPKYIQNLCDSMPRRVAAVIANNDGYTTTDFVIIHT